MANLEVAADELVRKLKSVDDEVEEAQDRFTELKGQLSSLGDQVDQDWTELARAVAELVEKAQEERGTLAREAQESAQAVSTLEATGQSAQQAASAGLDAAESGTQQLTQAMSERAPQVDSAAEAGERTFEALRTQAAEVSEQLGEVLQQARDFITDEVVSGFESMQEELTDRFAEMRTTLTEECTSALQDAYDDWSAKLDEVVQTVEEEGFQAAHENAQEVVDWALAECATAHQQELDRLLEVAGVVQDALRTLQEEAGECSTDVGEEGRSALQEAVTETQQALTGMIGALDACRQVMASYSFVQM